MLSRRRHPLRGRLATAALSVCAGLLCLSTLLACSSGEPTDPRVPAGRDDTYVFATMELVHIGPPCDGPCGALFYDCEELSPYLEGETWQMYGDLATAGVTEDVGNSRNIAVTASDTTAETGVAIEFRVSDLSDPNNGIALRGIPLNPMDCDQPTVDVTGVFADVQALCSRINGTLVSEARFQFDPCEPWSIEITSWETDGGGLLQQAVSTGGNQFSPSGIMEGRFSFVGQSIQNTPFGELVPHVIVEGCFRVNVPGGERGVPANPNVTASLCTP